VTYGWKEKREVDTGKSMGAGGVMSVNENQYNEKKSLRYVIGKTARFEDLAADCVAFANARGGIIVIGIEDDAVLPAVNQKIDDVLPSLINKRITELSTNVSVAATREMADNGGEYIRLMIFPNTQSIACTNNGKYYYRIADTSRPLFPDELGRLFTDKTSFVWETSNTRKVSRNNYDNDKLQAFVDSIHDSKRVSQFVKAKSIDELLDYYHMADRDYLTNLGVLWIGKRNDRFLLPNTPMIQFFKYDERGNRVNKIVWDDCSLNPAELIDSVWQKVPDWQEGIEVPDGMYRKLIANYEEVVIRELLTNALVHRPYTTGGDLFLNLYPNRLEIKNPGRLPIGVTPENILHQSVRRNTAMAQLFYDLHLMEKEGSGYDRMYQVLLNDGKEQPEVVEGEDSVTVIIRRNIIKPDRLTFINRINNSYSLTQTVLYCAENSQGSEFQDQDYTETD
jgi:ATP-dependent DNA helicase RecG